MKDEEQDEEQDEQTEIYAPFKESPQLKLEPGGTDVNFGRN